MSVTHVGFALPFLAIPATSLKLTRASRPLVRDLHSGK
jgi:hypothetical protein